MPNQHSTLTGLFTDVANAIRAKTGGSASIVADDFPSAIGAISPSISVSAAGVVTATCGQTAVTHTLSASDDADFVAGNIKKNVTIFGVTGTLDSGGETYVGQITSDASGASGRGTIDFSSLGDGVFHLVATPAIPATSTGKAVTEMYLCISDENYGGVRTKNTTTFTSTYLNGTAAHAGTASWQYVNNGAAVTYNCYKIVNLAW